MSSTYLTTKVRLMGFLIQVWVVCTAYMQHIASSLRDSAGKRGLAVGGPRDAPPGLPSCIQTAYFGSRHAQAGHNDNYDDNHGRHRPDEKRTLYKEKL